MTDIIIHNVCPVCGHPLREVRIEDGPAYFSIQHCDIVQDFKSAWECPTCECLFEFDYQADEVQIPF